MLACKALLLATICVALGTVPAARAGTSLPARLQAADRGPTDPAKIITITVHLAMPNKAGFEKALAALYDRSSPTFHHWMTDADLQKFAPPQAQRDAVQKTLEASGLTLISTDKNGFSLRARGTVGNVARAFNTEIHDFQRNGETFRGIIAPAVLNGSAAAYVHAVAGLESHTVHPMLTRSKNLKTGQAPTNIALGKIAAAGGLNGVITDLSLSPSETATFTGPGKHPPTAVYTGIVYGDNPALAPDFGPKQLENVYNLQGLYKQGKTGTGQTVVLIEGYGYPTAESDANAQFKLAGLPKLTAANFSILYPDGTPDPTAGILTGWNIEIALDIQSSHAIAPGANIVVLATNGQDGEDFQYSMQYVIDNNIGYAVSNSWEEDTDLVAGAPEQQSYEDILEIAAAKGISFQFSTGDDGDAGLGTPLGAAGVPSVSPHATAVGGTAILNNVGGKGFTPVSWGDAFAFIDDGTYAPFTSYVVGGGGGGESVYWPKPGWQQSLPGLGRQTPDVSALADPYTGFPLVVTDSGAQYLEPGWGGTSLASPIFTALWAIAQQAAGGPLGQASPLLAGLKTGLRDVVPLTNANDITVVASDKHKSIDYSTLDIFSESYEQNTVFVGAIYIDASSFGIGFAFGLDTSLTTNAGWDNATGYGTPQNGVAFINAIVAAAKP